MSNYNLYQILQETLDDCRVGGDDSIGDDCNLIELLKLNLVHKASDSSYRIWEKHITNNRLDGVVTYLKHMQLLFMLDGTPDYEILDMCEDRIKTLIATIEANNG